MRDLRLSLHARIIAFIAAILAVGAVMLGFAAWEYARVAARDAYDKLLIGGVVQVAENVFVQGGVVTLDPPAAAFATLAAYDHVFYRVTDPRGVVVAGYEDLVTDIPADRTRQGVQLADGTFQGRPVRIAVIAKQIDDAQAGGWAEIAVAQTLGSRVSLTWDLTGKAAGLIGIMSLLALAAGVFAIRLALAPLMRIEAEIASRKPDDLRPIQVTPPHEAAALVGAIDDFMRRLDTRITAMQRFIADAAHQIRTPLAALDAQAELLSNETNPPDQAEQTARLREKITELGRLTSQLLDHAMIIHRSETAQIEAIDLNALAKSTLAQAVPLSFEREVSVSFVPHDGEVLVRGDAISLREALSNLIHNALTHGAASRLAVQVGQTGSTAFMVVCDDGPGIPEADRERLCRPFQTGDGQTGGAGLGLAIASDVARKHGGAVSFADGADGFCVTLTITA